MENINECCECYDDAPLTAEERESLQKSKANPLENGTTAKMNNLPKNPDQAYMGEGWGGWAKFLGQEPLPEVAIVECLKVWDIADVRARQMYHAENWDKFDFNEKYAMWQIDNFLHNLKNTGKDF